MLALISLIGLFIVFVAALVIVGRWIEKSLWDGKLYSWRRILKDWFAQDMVALRKLQAYSDSQDESLRVLQSLKVTRDKEFVELYHRVYDDDGLEAQVRDLKQVLEWTRTRLNDAKQEVLSQMGVSHQLRSSIDVHKDVLRDYRKEMRHRATMIRKLTERIQTYLLRGKVVGVVANPKQNETLKSWVMRNPLGYTSPAMKIRKKRQVLDTRKRK